MKCDELKEDYCYDATDDKTKAVYLKSDVDEAIAELKVENERLVKCCKEYDSRQRISERIKFNGAKELRATKRALWLARAERALSDFAWHQQTAETLLRGGTSAAVDYQKWKAKNWKNVERKCRAKAEEYK